MMITDYESIRRMDRLNISPPLRKLSDGALMSMNRDEKMDNIFSAVPTHANANLASYPSGGCIIWPNNDAQYNVQKPVSALDLATSSSQQAKDIFFQRKQREFTPENKKNTEYWDRRRRNNEAAKRSREKRRLNDMVLETRVVRLMRENAFLKVQLSKICENYNLDFKEILAEASNLADDHQQQSDSVHNFKSVPESPPILPLLRGPPDFSHGNHDGLADNFDPLLSSPTYLHLPQKDSRRRHSCGSRPHIDGLTSSRFESDYSDQSNGPPQITIQNSDDDPIIDGLLTPPKEDVQGNGFGGSISPSLPHKLRHKAHIGDREWSAAIKTGRLVDEEPISPFQTNYESRPDSPISDHVAKFREERPMEDRVDNHGDALPKVSTVELKYENDKLRTELNKLADEVASLKDVVLTSSGDRKRKKSVVKNAPYDHQEQLIDNKLSL